MTGLLAPLDEWPQSAARIFPAAGPNGGPNALERELARYCTENLGSGLERLFFFELGVGAVFGARLRDGRRVRVKAHPHTLSRAYLAAMQRVQSRVREGGIPAPQPLGAPAALAGTLATAEEWLTAGRFRDPQRAEIRRALAASYARTIELTREFSGEAALGEGFDILHGEPLWPTPHSAVFDFEATAAGAEWIDDLAAAARDEIRAHAGPPIAGHSDWSSKHFRFRGTEIVAVYDWDSLVLAPEECLVASNAAHFTSHPPHWRAPSVDETRRFVDEYEEARSGRFDERQRRALESAIVYATAYTARCEHAIDTEGERWQRSFRQKLRALAG